MLKGTKIIDLSRVMAGPYCGMLLADLGATTIKVERPGTGDETRAWGPPFDARGESAYFLSVNRNKLSLAADLSDAADRATVLSLVSDADVVIENFLPGVLGRWGISPAELLSANQRLIWCTISGFGPGSTRPGYDFVVQAECGWMAVTGEVGGEPMKAGVAFADISAGKDAAIGILAALFARGRGPLEAEQRLVHISLAATATAMLTNVAQNHLVSGSEARRWGNAHPNLVPYQLFKANDRSVVIAVGSDAQWKACAEALGLHDLAGDPGLAGNSGRLARRKEIVEAIARTVAAQTAAHWLDRLAAAGVPCGLVRTVAEAVAAVGASPLTGIAPAIGGFVRRPPPRLDEHGPLIRKYGWDADSF